MGKLRLIPTHLPNTFWQVGRICWMGTCKKYTALGDGLAMHRRIGRYALPVDKICCRRCEMGTQVGSKPRESRRIVADQREREREMKGVEEGRS